MNKYTIIEANVKDNKNKISPVLKRNLEGFSSQRFDWNYENCPYGHARCWMAKHNESNSYVGSGAIFPRKIFIDNEPVYAGIAGDFAVDKGHRAFGPAISLQKEIQKKLKSSNTKFIYGVPNELSNALFKRIGYKEVGTFNRFVKILKIGRMPEEYLPSFLRYRTLSRIIDFFIKMVSRELRYRKTDEYSIETPDSVDDRFNRFWNKVSKQYDIIGERTAEFLSWRYKEPHPQNYQIFCIVNKNKEIKGYIAYDIKSTVYHIVDMLYDKSDMIIDSLLAEFIIFARAKGIGAIIVRYLGHELLMKKLKKFNFLIRNDEKREVIVYSAERSLKSKLLNVGNWHFFRSDNDT